MYNFCVIKRKQYDRHSQRQLRFLLFLSARSDVRDNGVGRCQFDVHQSATSTDRDRRYVRRLPSTNRPWSLHGSWRPAAGHCIRCSHNYRLHQAASSCTLDQGPAARHRPDRWIRWEPLIVCAVAQGCIFVTSLMGACQRHLSSRTIKLPVAFTSHGSQGRLPYLPMAPKRRRWFLGSLLKVNLKY